MKRIVIVLASMVFVLCAAACVKGERNIKVKTITSFERITLNVSGMRMSENFEILKTDDGFELSHYAGFSVDFDDEKSKQESLVKKVICSHEEYEQMIAFLNECKFGSWNGFDKAAKHVLDGEMFTLKANVNGSQKIYAQGSNAYPKHYHEFTQKLSELLSE